MHYFQLLKESFLVMARSKALWMIMAIPVAVRLFMTPSMTLAAFSYRGVALKIILLAVNAFATGAVISMVDVIAGGKRVGVSHGFKAGLRWLRPLLIIEVVLLLPIWALRFFVSVFLESSADVELLGALGGNFIALQLLLFLLGILTGAISVGAERFIVLAGVPIAAALRRGCWLVVDRLRDFTIIGLLTGVVVSVITGSAKLMLTVASIAHQEYGFLTTLITGVIELILVVMAALWLSSVWTLAFRHWQRSIPLRCEV